MVIDFVPKVRASSVTSVVLTNYMTLKTTFSIHLDLAVAKISWKFVKELHIKNHYFHIFTMFWRYRSNILKP